ncbi:MAG: hypothetical protein OXI26_09440 [bacterium]|nr:hypothetical protein [bacterium]
MWRVTEAEAAIVEPAAAPGTWLVAVDDDPTGCQSVSGIPLLTRWDTETLTEAARRAAPVTFVLTNSRSLDRAEASRLNGEVGRSLATVAERLGLALRLISRSDSTLRGHYPAEVTALATGAGMAPDGVLICPCFFEAGRYTAGGIHWVLADGELIPARETEFARDETFGHTELTLTEWADARSDAPASASQIAAADLAAGDRAAVRAVLEDAADGRPVVVNATNYAQLDVLVDVIEDVEAAGRCLVYRTGPSFVRARARLGPPALADLVGLAGGDERGLVAVGSLTALTRTQVARARAVHGLAEVELNASLVLEEVAAAAHVESVAAEVADELATRDVVLATSAAPAARTDHSALQVSRTVSGALVAAVRRISELRPPGWVVAKGGITSHDLLSRAFEVGAATVVGQARPGIVPVLAIESGGRRWPFLIFPGNVGSPDVLAEIVGDLVRRS